MQTTFVAAITYMIACRSPLCRVDHCRTLGKVLPDSTVVTTIDEGGKRFSVRKNGRAYATKSKLLAADEGCGENLTLGCAVRTSKAARGHSQNSCELDAVACQPALMYTIARHLGIGAPLLRDYTDHREELLKSAADCQSFGLFNVRPPQDHAKQIDASLVNGNGNDRDLSNIGKGVCEGAARDL